MSVCTRWDCAAVGDDHADEFPCYEIINTFGEPIRDLAAPQETEQAHPLPSPVTPEGETNR